MSFFAKMISYEIFLNSEYLVRKKKIYKYNGYTDIKKRKFGQERKVYKYLLSSRG